MPPTVADALNLDIRTLAVVSVFVLAIAGLVPIALRQLAPDEDAVRTWSGAAALGVTATVLAAQRSQIWPVLGHLAADALAATGFVLVVQGTRQIIGQRAPRRVAFAHGVAFAALDVFLVHLTPLPWLRSVVLIAIFAVWGGIGAAALFRSGLQSGRFLGVVFALLSGLGWVRVAMLVTGAVEDPIFAPSLARLIDFGGAIVLGALGTVGALLLVADVVLTELRAQAYRDALTGLANRAALKDSAARELARARRLGQPLGMLILDIDHFKSVNDRLGHAAGDEVLRAVAQALRNALRREDEIGRFGGEEFVALLPGAGELELALIGERLRRAVVESPVVIAGQTVRVTVSAGGTLLGVDENDWSAGLERADKNLYAAKNEGRDRVIVGSGEGLPASPKHREPVLVPPRQISGSAMARRESALQSQRRASGEIPRR